MTRRFLALMVCTWMLVSCGGPATMTQVNETTVAVATQAATSAPTMEVPTVAATAEPTATAVAEPTDVTPDAATTVAGEATTEAATVTSAQDTYPMVITHALGTVTIPTKPQRIVALSTNDIDTVLAFGLTPVVVSADPFNDDGIYPWHSGRIDKNTVAIVSDEISLETIAAAQPDLILATKMYGIDEIYDKLAQIAPTVINQVDVSAQTWQEQTLLAGHALGDTAKAQEMIDDTQNHIDQVRDTNPGLLNKTYSLSYISGPNQITTIFDEKDYAVKFFKQLGLNITPSLRDLQAMSATNPGSQLSFEQLTLLDGDMVIAAYDNLELQASVESNPLLQQLDAVKNGRYLRVDLETIAALRLPTVHGIPWALEQIEPFLKQVATE